MPQLACRLAALLLLIVTSCIRAGELRLGNGAVLPGELASINLTKLVWKADKIGEITGANPSEELTVNFTARWLRPGHRHNIDISTDYEQTNGTTTDDDADANYQYDLLRPDDWYWFGRARYYSDEFQALQEVYAASAGRPRYPR